jgi:capsular exopolysaccharide synthesis family protein
MPAHVQRGRVRPNNARDQFWRHLLTESIDATRTMLVHTARQDSLRVIMVTSALGGEGKTMVSSHLAVSLARAGLRTLLLDSDLRRPAIHRIFNLPVGPGLAELLRGEADLAAAVKPGPLPGLSILPAGQPNGQALQALTQGILSASLQHLREQFDFIIIDSAPVLPVPDSQLIGQCADGVVLAIRHEVSRLAAVTAAAERLTSLDIRLLGAVVNGEKPLGYDSAYYHTNLSEGKALSHKGN